MKPYDVKQVAEAAIANNVRTALEIDKATRVVVVPDGNGTYTVKARFDGPGND